MSGHRHGEEENNKSFSQQICEKRRREDRRRQPSNGFARISVVGWICRRERLRRTGGGSHRDESDT